MRPAGRNVDFFFNGRACFAFPDDRFRDAGYPFGAVHESAKLYPLGIARPERGRFRV